MKKFAVVAAGRAYTDLVAHVSTAFLSENNMPLNAGRSLSVEELKQIQKGLTNPEMIAGGQGANSVAVVSALGGKAGFFGKVNDDEIGNFFLEDFKRRGVTLCCPVFDNTIGMSATTLVMLTENGNRSIAYNGGCADRFVPADFQSFDFLSTDFFLVESLLIYSPDAASIIKEAISLAKGKTKIVINIQGAVTCKQNPEVAQFMADNADIIMGNEAEHEAFSHFAQIPKSPQQIIVITKGENGAEARVGSNTYSVAAQCPAKLISSVGAGDAFTAGFLLALSRGLNINNSLECATRVATEILGVLGGRPTSSLVHLMELS